MSKLFKIATWNINSVRVRIKELTDWLQRSNIDILLLQEIKCETEKFPSEMFEDLGYNCYVNGQKSYNGVAIISKLPCEDIITDFADNPCSGEARYIEAGVNLPVGFARISSIYVPNGGEVGSEKFVKKLLFLDKLHFYLKQKELDENFIIGGDFNVAPFDDDVYSAEELKNTTCFTIEERKKIRAIYNQGWLDPYLFFRENNDFSWWDYRGGAFQHNKGMRIDYLLMNNFASKYINNCYIDKETRGVAKSSDHAPVILEFKI